MWLFLASEAMILAGLFAAVWVVRTLHPDGAVEASAHLDKWLGTGNTALLLTSSLLVTLAAAGAGARHPVRLGDVGLTDPAVVTA